MGDCLLFEVGGRSSVSRNSQAGGWVPAVGLVILAGPASVDARLAEVRRSPYHSYYPPETITTSVWTSSVQNGEKREPPQHLTGQSD